MALLIGIVNPGQSSTGRVRSEPETFLQEQLFRSFGFCPAASLGRHVTPLAVLRPPKVLAAVAPLALVKNDRRCEGSPCDDGRR
jgi:hypothetical protein